MTADYAGNGSWGDDDPSMFFITAFGGLQGEFQVTNGYGRDKAPQVMKVRKRYMHVKRQCLFTTFFFCQNEGFI